MPNPGDRHQEAVATATVGAAVLSIMAGAIHLTVMPDHFAEWWGFGVFMLVTGLGQVATGVLLLRGPARWLLWVMISGTLLPFGLFVLAYSVGLPVGPNAGTAEALNGAVVVSKVTEGLLVVALVFLLRTACRPHAADRSSGSKTAGTAQMISGHGSDEHLSSN